jgi:hypothetical protein
MVKVHNVSALPSVFRESGLPFLGMVVSLNMQQCRASGTEELDDFHIRTPLAVYLLKCTPKRKMPAGIFGVTSIGVWLSGGFCQTANLCRFNRGFWGCVLEGRAILFSFSGVSLLSSIWCLLISFFLFPHSHLSRVEFGIVKGLRMPVYTKVSTPEKEYSSSGGAEIANVSFGREIAVSS